MTQKKSKPAAKKVAGKNAPKKASPVKKAAANSARKPVGKAVATPKRAAAPAKKTLASKKAAPAKKAARKALVAPKKAPPKPAAPKAPPRAIKAPAAKKIATKAGKPAAPKLPAKKAATASAAPRMKPTREEPPAQPQIDYSIIVPGAAEIDMRVFTPPKPLEIASGEAMSDDDLATLREMEATHEAVDRVRQNAKLKAPPPEFDGKHCVTCEDEEIEAGRRKLGYFTCIYCESEKERLAKMFAR